MKISQVFRDFKGRKGSQVERRGRRRQEKGCEKCGLTDISCHLQIHRHYRTLPLATREGRTGTQPHQKPEQTKTEPEFEFSAKRRLSAFNPQLRLRPFDQIPASRTRGLEKKG